jgi:hypothetical protein
VFRPRGVARRGLVGEVAGGGYGDWDGDGAGPGAEAAEAGLVGG